MRIKTKTSLIIKSAAELAEVSREALKFPLKESERFLAEKCLGEALIKLGKTKEALETLAPIISKDPSNPLIIEPLARKMVDYAPSLTLDLLLPVIRAEPGWKQRKAWQNSLRLFYKAFSMASPKREPKALLARKNRVFLPLPKKWNHAIWEPGYRVWRPEGIGPSRVYSGKKKIRVFIPFSAGWRRLKAPPNELSRWRNSPFAISRGRNGPFFVLYWFGPDVKYWYGTTPRIKGVTGKAVKGSTKTGIVSLVSKYCYNKAARERNMRFYPAAPLRFSLGIKSGVIKKAWKRKAWIYDERFFSVGRITCETTLKIMKKDVEKLGPELSWLYRNVKVVK